MKSRRSIAALLFFLAIISSVSLALFSCTGEETGSGVTEPEYDIPSGAILGKGVETAIIANYEVGTNTEIYLRKVYDEVILKTDDFPFVGADTNPQAEHELVFGDTSRDITLQAKRLLSDKITSDSPTIFGEDYDEADVIGYAIYAHAGSVAVVWNDIHAEEKAYERFLGSCFSEDYLVLEDGYFYSELFSLSAYLDERAEKIREDGWTNLAAQIPEEYRDEIIEEYKKIYTLYDEEMVVWLANLYDPGVGGFYFASSARDTEGYLPDIESTYSAFRFVADSGMAEMFFGNWSKAIPKEVLVKALDWVYSLRDSNGFYYHPQWPKGYIEENGLQSRITRDKGSANYLINMIRGVANYTSELPSDNNLYGRLCDCSTVVAVSKVVSTAEMLWQYESPENFKEYLAGLEAQLVGASDITKAWKFYYWGNLFQSTTGYVGSNVEMRRDLIDFFERHQDPTTGLWSQGLYYDSANGLHKIASVYNSLNEPLKYIEEMVDSIFVILMFDVETNPSAIVSVYNTWSCLPYIYNNIRNHSSLPLLEREARCTEIKNRVYAQAADAIRITYGQVVGTKMPDGAFGYNRNGSTYAAQGCPIAVPGTREGDMNGNYIASIDIVKYIAATLDLAEYEIPLFTERERVLFVSIIEELSPVEKKYPRPSSLPDLSKYQ